MEKINTSLNLARKWRPKTFDQIIGQQISIRMLKNGLFLQKLFPVYLFAGQRGCGKTSTARIFGSAINCKNLKKFQKEPSFNIPCLECDSCKSMIQINHPDFIEIDAASHTGVENVRQILESCSYMPILGNKKIYLIDEAHMLSKSAFNAFLKVLEEPPSSALFILATTEIQKFPETVLSRCFQVIFKSVKNNDLKLHLKQICETEKINIKDQALDLLIQETEGSVRDAINLLERIRFSEAEITTESILQILGKISEAELLELFDILLDKKPEKLLINLNSIFSQNTNPQILWNMIIQLCRTLLWIKFKAENLPNYFNDIQTLKKLSEKCSLNRLNSIMQLLWNQEEIFLKTPQKKIFLETVLLQICQQTNIYDIKDFINQSDFKIGENTEEHEENYGQLNTSTKNFDETKNGSQNNQWKDFLKKVSNINDNFLISIFNQAKFISKDDENKKININLSNNGQFFKDKINESKNIWKQYFTECFPNFIDINFIAIQNEQPKKNIATFQTSNDSIKTKTFSSEEKSSLYKNTKNIYSIPINISDENKWPKANLITKYFPGKIKSGKNYN